MTITPTNASGTATNVAADGSATTADTKNQFLLLLVNELQNQDPTAPTDEKETLSQLAQFSQLEQIQNLNQTLTTNSGVADVAQSATLIGKTVSTGTDTDAGISGVVSSVSLTGGKTFLQIGSQSVDASTITSIKQ